MPVLQRDRAQIYYESKGQGPAIVFAHGAGGNAAIWFNQIAEFAGDYQCIAFDHRGFARSPAQGDALSVQDFRDDLLAIMDELDVAQAHLVGQSMGGFTVLRTVLDAPDRVSSITFSCTSGGIYNPQPTAAVKNLTASRDDDASGVQQTMSAVSQRNTALMQLYESVNNFNTEFSWARLSGLLGKGGVVQHNELAAVACPVLFISGAEDPLFPPEQLKAMVPHFPNGKIEIIENAGHSPYFERPDVFNQILRAHIRAAGQ